MALAGRACDQQMHWPNAGVQDALAPSERAAELTGKQRLNVALQGPLRVMAEVVPIDLQSL